MKKSPLYIADATPARAGLAVFAAILCLASPALHSACGLNFCPRLEPEGKNTLEIGLMVKQVGFDIGGNSGTYTDFMPEVLFNLKDRWVFGVNLPIILLDVGGHAETGISNPMGFAEFRFEPTYGQRMGLGIQLEVPLGNDEKGMAGNHFMAVPYLSWAKPLYPFFVIGSVGGSFGLSDEHGHGAPDSTSHHASASPTSLYVNPHENMEILYRIAGGTNLWNRKIKPELSINGQHVLTGDNSYGNADDYITFGVAAPMLLGPFTLSPHFELPVTSARRMEWSAGLTGRTQF